MECTLMVSNGDNCMLKKYSPDDDVNNFLYSLYN